MSEINISKRTIKKFLRFKPNPIPMLDVRNKLELLAVKTGLKPTFQEYTHVRSDINPNLALLKQMGNMLGLKHKFTINPPLYFSRKPNVKSSFLDAYYAKTDFESLWVYDDPKVESTIVKCVSGKLNEGYVLGYPECCIKWHEEARVLEVESIFKDIETYIATHSFELTGLQVETEEEMYEAILNIPYPHENQNKWQKIIDQHLFGTWKKFPFVPHWACSACLSGKSKKTEKLNNEYRELAKKVNLNFEKDFIREVKQFLKIAE